MNKWIKYGMLAVLALAVVFAGVGVAAAQEGDPPVAPPMGPWGHQPGYGVGPGQGLMADYSDIIHEAIADALGINVSDFEAAIEDGETVFSLAQEYGVDFDELRAAMDEARAEAVDQAIEDGTITEEQAEWMKQGPRGHGPLMGECDGAGPMRDGSGEFGPRGGRWGGRS